MASSRDQHTFTCDVCQRQAGRELLVCQRRLENTCPFDSQQHRLMSKRMIMASLLFGSVAILGAMLLFFALPLDTISEFSRWMIYGAGAVIFSMGFATCAHGIYGIFGKQSLVINPHTRQLWQEHHLFGVCIRQSTVTHAHTLGDTLDLDSPHLPVSLVALYINSDGTSYRGRLYKRVYIGESAHYETARIVMMMTLIGLLATGALKLWRTTTIKHDRTMQEYVLTAGEHAAVVGALESHMLEIIQCWEADVNVFATSPQGIPIKTFTGKLYNHLEIDPYNTLLEQVRQDAVIHDVAQVQRGTFHFKHEHTGFLNRDGLRVQRLYEEFIRRWEPDFLALRQQITDGIENHVDGS